MKEIYYSLFFVHYKLIQYGKAGKLWAASSTSYAIPVIAIIALHFTLGELLGREIIDKRFLIPLGIVIIILWSGFNLIYFLKNNKYLEIEAHFFNDHRKRKIAYIIFFIYLCWIVCAFYFAIK